MPEFTIEATYRLPVFRHRTYVADSLEEACRLAIEDDDWSHQKEDYDTAGETYVTGIWEGADAAYRGTAVPIPPHFDETMQRQAVHYEVLLGVLKIMLGDADAGRPTSPDWRARAAWAVDKAEAILAGARGPDEPAPPESGP